MSQIFAVCSGNDTPAEAPAPVAVPTEALDQSQAVEIVLRKALAHDGLARGLREVTRCGITHEIAI